MNKVRPIFHTRKPHAWGRARKRSSWWRLTVERIAGRSRCLCATDEAPCPSSSFLGPSPCPPLLSRSPPACSSGLGADAAGARLSPAALRTQWEEAGRPLRAGGGGARRGKPAAAPQGVTAPRRLRRAATRHEVPEGPELDAHAWPQRSRVILPGATGGIGRRRNAKASHSSPGSELQPLTENP